MTWSPWSTGMVELGARASESMPSLRKHPKVIAVAMEVAPAHYGVRRGTRYDLTTHRDPIGTARGRFTALFPSWRVRLRLRAVTPWHCRTLDQQGGNHRLHPLAHAPPGPTPRIHDMQQDIDRAETIADGVCDDGAAFCSGCLCRDEVVSLREILFVRAANLRRQKCREHEKRVSDSTPLRVAS